MVMIETSCLAPSLPNDVDDRSSAKAKSGRCEDLCADRRSLYCL